MGKITKTFVDGQILYAADMNEVKTVVNGIDDSMVKGIKVNGTAIAKDTDGTVNITGVSGNVDDVLVNGTSVLNATTKKADILIAQGTTDGTIKVQGVEIAPKGVDATLVAKVGKLPSASDVEALVNKVDKLPSASDVQTMVDKVNKLPNASDVQTMVDKVNKLPAAANIPSTIQEKLVAGTGITIAADGKTISVSGSGETVDWADIENKPDIIKDAAAVTALTNKINSIPTDSSATNPVITKNTIADNIPVASGSTPSTSNPVITKNDLHCATAPSTSNPVLTKTDLPDAIPVASGSTPSSTNPVITKKDLYCTTAPSSANPVMTKNDLPSASATEAGMVKLVSTYSATGADAVTGAGVKAALDSIDVSEVGEAGKYIQKIKQEDSKIVATLADVKQTYSGTDTEPISGKGVKAAIDALDVTDTAVDKKYISKIDQEDGKISITREFIPVYDVKVGGTTVVDSSTKEVDFKKAAPTETKFTSHTDADGNVIIDTVTKLEVATANEAGLVLGSDVAIVKKYVDDKIDEKLVAAGAGELNILEGVKVGTTELTITDKKVTIDRDASAKGTKDNAIKDVTLTGGKITLEYDRFVETKDSEPGKVGQFGYFTAENELTGKNLADTYDKNTSGSDNNGKVSFKEAAGNYTVPTAHAIHDYLDDVLGGIAGAMTFKGSAADIASTTFDENSVGFTFIVETAGTYASIACEVGDMLIVKSVSGTTPAWTHISATTTVENKEAEIKGGTALTDVAKVGGTTITAKLATASDTVMGSVKVDNDKIHSASTAKTWDASAPVVMSAKAVEDSLGVKLVDGTKGIQTASATASGTNAVALGGTAQATGNGSIAFGQAAIAESMFSVAMVGGKTTGSTRYAVAIGQGSVASANAAVAIGGGEASAINAVAVGSAVASGGNSVAVGRYVTASNGYETVFGTYNDSHTGSSTEEQTRFSIGIGTSASDKKNAIEVMGDGKMFVEGIGGYDGTNPADAKPLQDFSVFIKGDAQASIDTDGSALGVENTIDPNAMAAMALGYINQVTQPGGIAIGMQNEVTGSGAVAIGMSNKATDQNAFACGESTEASGDHSFASGYSTIAAGQSSFAGGSGAAANGNRAFAFGQNVDADGSASVAMGLAVNSGDLKASGNGSFAMGITENSGKILASGKGAVAMGVADGGNLTAAGDGAVAMGKGAVASGNGAVAIGFVDGTGKILSDAPGAFVAGYASNNQEHKATGPQSVTFGRNSKATGSQSFVMGNSSTASGECSFVSGKYSSASKIGAVAFGVENAAAGEYSFAGGHGSRAAGDGSFVFGIAQDNTTGGSLATGQGSGVMGSTIGAGVLSASGKGAHSFGYVSDGGRIDAQGDGSFASGITENSDKILAVGKGSVAIGVAVTAKNVGEAALGTYNISHKASDTFGDAGNTAFSVGIGTNTENKNALEVMQNGDIYIMMNQIIMNSDMYRWEYVQPMKVNGSPYYLFVSPDLGSTKENWRQMVRDGLGVPLGFTTTITVGENVTVYHDMAEAYSFTDASETEITCPDFVEGYYDTISVESEMEKLQDLLEKEGSSEGGPFKFNETGDKSGAEMISTNGNCADGKEAFAAGDDCAANGSFSIAMGQGAAAEEQASVAMGKWTVASGEGSFAMGFADGTDCIIASGKGAIAAGYSDADGAIIASGVGSVALGYNDLNCDYTLEAKGVGAVAIGLGDYAEGAASVAIGSNNYSDKNRAVAIGDANTSSGESAVALGTNCYLNGDYTNALGYSLQTKASADRGQTVVGKYNADLDDSVIFAVGVGADTNNRKNALEITSDGVFIPHGRSMDNIRYNNKDWYYVGKIEHPSLSSYFDAWSDIPSMDLDATIDKRKLADHIIFNMNGSYNLVTAVSSYDTVNHMVSFAAAPTAVTVNTNPPYKKSINLTVLLSAFESKRF